MPKPWRVLHSERLLHDRWIDLRADRCLTEEGAEIAPYYVLTYPDWVHVVALTAADEVVLVEQYRHGAGAVCLELPGGVIEPGEGVVDAALRELREETGYVAGRARLVSALYANPATQTNRVHAVLAEECRLAAPTQREAGETGMSVRLMGLDAVVAGASAGLLPQSMQVAGLMLAVAARRRG